MGLCKPWACLSGFRASRVFRNDWNPVAAGGTRRVSRLVESGCVSSVNLRLAGRIVHGASSTLVMNGEKGEIAI